MTTPNRRLKALCILDTETGIVRRYDVEGDTPRLTHYAELEKEPDYDVRYELERFRAYA